MTKTRKDDLSRRIAIMTGWSSETIDLQINFLLGVMDNFCEKLLDSQSLEKIESELGVKISAALDDQEINKSIVDKLETLSITIDENNNLHGLLVASQLLADLKVVKENMFCGSHDLFKIMNNMFTLGKHEYLSVFLPRMSYLAEGVQPSINRGIKFNNGSKEKRLDALGKVMLETAKDLRSHTAKPPTAQELFEAMPIGIHVLKIYDDAIEWRNPAGVHKITSFKRFEARFTRINKDFFDKTKKSKKTEISVSD